MNTEYTSPSQDKSFIPLLLIGVSLILFFGYQLSEISKARENLQNSKKQIEDFVAVNIPKVNGELTKEQQVEDTLKKLAGDLLDLSKTDDNAKQVVDHLEAAGIKFQAPQAAQAPAPASVP